VRARGRSRGSSSSGSSRGISVVAVVVGVDATWPGSTSSTGRSSPSCKSHQLPTFTVKGNVFPYLLPSVGPGADPGVQAVSPQVT